MFSIYVARGGFFGGGGRGGVHMCVCCVVSVCLCLLGSYWPFPSYTLSSSCNTLSHPHFLLPIPHSLPTPHSLLPVPYSLLPILPPPHPPSSPSSLLPLLPPGLTVAQVNQYLDDLANGNTSTDRAGMKKALQLLLRNTSALEQKWLIRIILKVAARVGGRAIQKGPRT